jgi:hypothetical protein
LQASYDCTAKERDPKFQYTYERNLKLVVTDGIVKKLAIAQGAYTADKSDDHWCNISFGDLKQVPSNVGVLLEAGEDDSAEDNGKCTVRIMGNADTMWIMIGDHAGDGSDCRQAGATMYCSPRAFWNDIILDRHTRKCKALQ